MALAELYLMFKENGTLDYEHEEENLDLKKREQSFSGDKDSFEFILKYLTDIKNEVPDEDGIREIVELWKESNSYNDWKENLDNLILKLQIEIEKTQKTLAV